MSKHIKNTKEGQKKEKKSIKRLEQINPNTAGIDVGSREHFVCVPEDRDETPVRKFGCFTSDINEIADWLAACKITSVAMESTGVYWIPLYQILETRGFEVKLVNAKHVKNVTGRKSDVSDCQWLQQLHSYGLLQGSFRPEDEICILRGYWRHRSNLVGYASRHIQHMQKALIQMNIQLHTVISDITGVTGMRIIRSILDGNRDPKELAKLRDNRIKKPQEEIAKALEGDYRQEHLFALKQALEAYEFYQRQIQQCDKEIEQYLTQMESKIDDPKQSSCSDLKEQTTEPSSNQTKFNLRDHLHRICGVDFTQIDGLDVLLVQTIVSEVGLDPNRFPSEKHFGSWLGLTPENRITGGKIKSCKSRKVVNRAAVAFRRAAQSLANSSSALGAFYRRMRARMGPAKANTATAYKIARIFYHMWKTGKQYQDAGADYYERQYKQQMIKNLKRKAALLGYELQPIQEAI